MHPHFTLNHAVPSVDADACDTSHAAPTNVSRYRLTRLLSLSHQEKYLILLEKEKGVAVLGV
jgi:hypothetical protein